MVMCNAIRRTVSNVAKTRSAGRRGKVAETKKSAAHGQRVFVTTLADIGAVGPILEQNSNLALIPFCPCGKNPNVH